ncbi:DUF1854 domain-containing protein [Hydrogenophaga defluvii]|uniref:DUF1854 domain-containing protein n=1 Tax=Hydrogenophaga defluvii TaxID=249410 RepID=A0ABW2S7P2_9BURK
MNLQRNTQGRLVLTTADGMQHEAVVPVRAYPISAPDRMISLVGADGHELAWLDTLDQLGTEARELVEEELRRREFMPEIKRLFGVSSFATPSTWDIETDRGWAQLQLKGEEDIRRMGGGVMLIADAHGVQFMIRDVSALDRHSRKLLDRFL